MIQTRYREDYPGEFVIISTSWDNGQKNQEKAWIPNPIEIHHVSYRAACIGTLTDKYKFDPKKIENHRGGLKGSKSMQTYGTGSIAETMNLHFTVEVDPQILAKLIKRNYPEEHIVYTTARNCVENPGEFYLIPFNPSFLTEVYPIYLAAFDGNKEIFMIGYNNDSQIENIEWTKQIEDIIRAYPTTVFYSIGVQTNMPQEWYEYTNVQHLTYREFISYADV